MVLKNILVLMDSLPAAAGRLELALKLAKQHGAGITGLNVVSHPLFELGKGTHDEAPDQRELFEAETARAGVEAVWQNCDVKGLRETVADAVNQQAGFADLIVLGQPEPGAKEKTSDLDLIEKVVLGSGKPVLIVPYAGSFNRIGRRVLVAWKTGRESSRALTDSLTLLQRAEVVSIFEVNPTEGEKDEVDKLCGHLERHGVTARLVTSAVTALPVGDVLLNRLADRGGDLLVMGAYAHGHFGSYAFGDVARHVLRHMTVPVLMSH